MILVLIHMVLQCRSTLKSQTCLVATTFVIVLGRTLQKNMIYATRSP